MGYNRPTSGIAEDLFGIKKETKVTGDMDLVEDDFTTDPVDEEEAKRRKRIKRQKKLMKAVEKWD